MASRSQRAIILSKHIYVMYILNNIRGTYKYHSAFSVRPHESNHCIHGSVIKISRAHLNRRGIPICRVEHNEAPQQLGPIFCPHAVCQCFIYLFFFCGTCGPSDVSSSSYPLMSRANTPQHICILCTLQHNARRLIKFAYAVDECTIVWDE